MTSYLSPIEFNRENFEFLIASKPIEMTGTINELASNIKYQDQLVASTAYDEHLFSFVPV